MITNKHTTYLSYIEAILGIQYNGTSMNDLAQFIKDHYQNARLKEPSFKEWLHGVKA